VDLLGERPWWRLEPEPLREHTPPGLGREFVDYHYSNYRDRASIDALLTSSLVGIGSREAKGPDPLRTGNYDAYGSPLSGTAGEAESWTRWWNECLGRAQLTQGPYREWFLTVTQPQLLDRFTDDKSLAATVPPRLHGESQPGSLVGIRERGVESFYEGACNLIDRSSTLEHQVWAAGAGMRVYDGQLFWLPEAVGAATLTSEAPDDDLVERIRLPFESVLVGLGRAVPAAALAEGDDETWRIAMAADGSKDALRGEPHLAAVWMAAHESGFGVAPVVVWFVETGGGISAVPGVWARSAYAGAVANLGAVLTWWDWVEPPPGAEIGASGSKERRQALKKSAVRKSIARGAFHKVRVLVIPATERMQSERDKDDDSPKRRSPIRHWRRAHWRKVRVAARDKSGLIIGSLQGEKDADWHYEGRWIPPVFVNASGPPDPGAKIYKQVAAGHRSLG
jgi:hypothetical protein